MVCALPLHGLLALLHHGHLTREHRRLPLGLLWAQPVVHEMSPGLLARKIEAAVVGHRCVQLLRHRHSGGLPGALEFTVSFLTCTRSFLMLLPVLLVSRVPLRTRKCGPQCLRW